jgi:hypothetical protein
MDADFFDSFTYSLLSMDEAPQSNNDLFTIEGDQLKTDEVFDAEIQTSYKIVVRVTDSQGLTFEKEMVISISDTGVKLSRKNTRITLTFNENILIGTTATALKSAISISQNANVDNPTYAPLALGDKVILFKKNKVVITLAEPLTSANNQIKFNANALKDSGGNMSADFTSDIFSADLTPPGILSTSVGNINNRITIRFSEAVFPASTAATAQLKLQDLKKAITLSTNANATPPTYSALQAKDVVSISKNRIIITLATPLTGANNRVNIAADAVMDEVGNKSGELTTATVSADLAAPTITGISLTGNKLLVIRFNETVTMNSTAAALKNAVKISTNGDAATPTYNALAIADTVATKKNTIEIKFATALSGNRLRIQVGADAVRDKVANKNIEQQTVVFAADSTSPTIQSIVKVSDKVFNIHFSEPTVIYSATALKDTEKLTALKAKITLTSNGNVGTPTYVALALDDKLAFKKGVLTITLANAMTGANNRFRFAAGSFVDASNNLSAEITTALIASDTNGPIINNSSLDATNKILTLTFNETIINNAPGTTDALKLTALRNGIQLATDGVNYTAIPATSKLTIKGNTLTIVFATGLTGNSNRVRIPSTMLRDMASNPSTQLTTTTIKADTSGPQLKS